MSKKLPNLPVTKEEKDFEKHLLQSLIKLSDGSREKVFSRGVRNDAQIFLYTCNICAVKNLPGERVLQTHIQGRKHQAKLSLPYLDAAQFRAQLISRKPTEIHVSPEPVPPGFEEELPPFKKTHADDLDEISSFSDSSINEGSNYNKSKSMSPFRKKLSESEKLQKSNGNENKPKLPTPKELFAQSTAIAQEGYKWEKYRVSVEIFVNKLNKDFKEYEKNPEKHPLYGDEWKKFWCRRFKELKAEGKDANKHDYRPEWIEFWTGRMKELRDEEIDKKKKEIRGKLQLPAEGEEKTEVLKEQYRVKVPESKKPVILNNSPVAILDSSSEDEIRSKTSEKKSRDKNRNIGKGRDREKDRYMERGRDRRDKKRGGGREHDKKRSFDDSEDSNDSRDRHYRKKYSREREYMRERSPRYRRLPPNLEYSPPPHIREKNERFREYKRYMETSYDKLSYDEWYARSYAHLQHQPSPPIPIIPPSPPEDDGPVTFVTVCRLLTALEEELGEKLGNKVTDLLCKALSLERVKANSSDEVLLNEENCQFFEVIKERLKGRILAEIVPPHKMHAVKKASRTIAVLLHQANERPPVDDKYKIQPEETTKPKKDNEDGSDKFDKQKIALELTQALMAQGKTDVTAEELEELIQVYIAMKQNQETAPENKVEEEKDAGEVKIEKEKEIELPVFKEKIIEPTVKPLLKRARSDSPVERFDNNKSPILATESPRKDKVKKMTKASENNLNSLTDEDLQTLLQSFFELSTDEQKYLIEYLKEIEKTDPDRVEKLRKYVRVDENDAYEEDEDAGPSTRGKTNNKKYDSPQPLKKITLSDSEDDYNFEEVFKKQNSSKSKLNANSNSNNFLLSDKQSMVQNLMGSLQNSVQSESQSIPSLSEPLGGNPGIMSIVPQQQHQQMQRHPGEQPFYQYQSEYENMMQQMQFDSNNYQMPPAQGEYGNPYFHNHNIGQMNMNSFNGPPGLIGHNMMQHQGPPGTGPFGF